MSDEKVGGLPELPEPVRMSSDQAYLGFTADQMHAYADVRVEAALSAHGQPVVDERTIRALHLAVGLNPDKPNADALLAKVCALRAAIGATHEH